ncbi:hypothetical protein Q1695_003715 [Nippostrongylus brasiliensis]|nr:hypothetical protein Q1695_003715 [Nippostrongylus brasiliensis]
MLAREVTHHRHCHFSNGSLKMFGPTHDDIAELIKDDMCPNPLQYYLLPEMEETGDDFEEFIDDDEGSEEVKPKTSFSCAQVHSKPQNWTVFWFMSSSKPLSEYPL